MPSAAKPKIRNPKSQIRNPKSEIRNPKSEIPKNYGQNDAHKKPSAGFACNPLEKAGTRKHRRQKNWSIADCLPANVREQTRMKAMNQSERSRKSIHM